MEIPQEDSGGLLPSTLLRVLFESTGRRRQRESETEKQHERFSSWGPTVSYYSLKNPQPLSSGNRRG